MKFTDINDPVPGKVHKQYWFTYPDGKWLFNRGTDKFYKYYPPVKGAPKRWYRFYHVELGENEQYVRYVRRGRSAAWLRYVIVDGQQVEIDRKQGAPPWMTRKATSPSNPERMDVQ